MAANCHLAVRQLQAMSGTTPSSTHISIPLGIIIGLLASFVQSLGLTIQRKSHVLNQLLPEHQQRVEHHRPLWLLGFAVFLSSNVIGSLVQIASLPVVILAPLGAVSLLWNAFFARLILGDVFSPWMILGTILIAGGAVLIAVFGIVPEPTRSLEDLLALFRRPTFVIYFSILGVVVLICLVVTHIADFTLYRRIRHTNNYSPSVSPSPDAHSTHALVTPPITDAGISTERTPLLKSSTVSPTSSVYRKSTDADTRAINHTRLLLAISYSSVSGIISGMCLLFAKSGVELLLLTLRGQNQFWQWQAWVLVIGLVVFALLQLWYLHKALVLADPTLVCPSAFCFYNVSSVVNGLVYFDQFSLIPPLHLGLVGLGMFILLGGVWVVSVQSGGAKEVEAWNESDDLDISALNRSLPDILESRIHAPVAGPDVLERGTRSEPNIRDLSGPHESENGISPPTRPSALRSLLSLERSPSLHLPATRSRVHHRRRTTYDAGSTPHRDLLPINTLGAGFQIGLSPVSPGFSIQPRERGRRLSGRGFADIVVDMTLSHEEQQRRRTVSEGDVRKRALAQRRTPDGNGDEDDDGRGQAGTDNDHRKKRREHGWDWLRKIFRR